MRKVLSVLAVIFAFFIIYFFQLNFFSWFNIAGVKPNLFIALILFIGLFMNNKLACVFGFFMGLYIDIIASGQVGISSIVYSIIGYLCVFLDKTFSKERKITLVFMVAGSTLVYELVTYFYKVITNGLSLQLLGFIKICFIEIIFNGLLTILLHPMIRNLGKFSERIFKDNKYIVNYI